MPFFEDSGSHLPWSVWTDPHDQWALLPSFVCEEYTAYFIVVVCLAHAVANGFAHQAAFFMAAVGGTWNDIFAMMLPKTDCFWQAQATIMLTPRLPLYIPCVYVVFGYTAMVVSMRLGWGRFAKACFSGLAARFIYAPYDVAGVVFLWWTWHDSDQVLLSRVFGAPAASTTWTLIHGFLLSYMWQVAMGPAPGRATLTARRAGAVIAATIAVPPAMTVVYMLIGLVFEKDFQVPTMTTYLVLDMVAFSGLVYGLVSPRVRTAARDVVSTKLNGLLLFAYAVHAVSFPVFFYLFDPTTHVSTGIHQSLGPCWTESTPLLVIEGANTPAKYEWTCEDQLNHDDFHQFQCDQFGAPHPEYIEGDTTNNQWYSVCGRELDRPLQEYMGIEIAYGVVIMVLVSHGLYVNTDAFTTADAVLKKTQ